MENATPPIREAFSQLPEEADELYAKLHSLCLPSSYFGAATSEVVLCRGGVGYGGWKCCWVEDGL